MKMESFYWLLLKTCGTENFFKHIDYVTKLCKLLRINYENIFGFSHKHQKFFVCLNFIPNLKKISKILLNASLPD